MMDGSTKPLASLLSVILLVGPGCVNARFGTTQPSDSSDGATAGVEIAPPRGMGGLIGADLGAASGYLIGAQPEKIADRKTEEARAAAERARVSPANVEDARRSDSADLNGDGFVTVDEIVAMQKSGLSDREMIDRLQRSRQVFVLTDQQQDYLRDRDVSQRVVDAMIAMKPDSLKSARAASAPIDAN